MYRSNTKKIKATESTIKGPANKTLLYIFLSLMFFGIVMIFDASVYKAYEVFGDSLYFVKQHLVWLIIGGGLGYFMYKVNYKIWNKLSPLILLGTITLLVLVLIFGKDINGAKRWFEIAGTAIQPAEFVKLSIVIYLSSILAKTSDKKLNNDQLLKEQFFKRLGTFVAVILVVIVLILAEPDMGTAMIIAITSFLIFFLSGEDRIHTIGSLAIAGTMGILGVLAGVVAPYRFERIKTYLHLLFKGEVDNPTGEGYQIQQILIGIGSSGFWGKGFGQSRQRFGYLVENTAFTDSIFAVVLEELGFAIAIIFVGVWLLVLFTGLKLAMAIEDKFGKLLVSGITVWLVTQALLNMAANVALIPLTGIPFPLLTYGGSNTIVTMMAIGLLLNISRYAKIETK